MGAPRHPLARYNVDWPQVLLELQSSGQPLHRLAARVGYAPNTLRNWRDGTVAEPPFSAGAALLDMWAERHPTRVPPRLGDR